MSDTIPTPRTYNKSLVFNPKWTAFCAPNTSPQPLPKQGVAMTTKIKAPKGWRWLQPKETVVAGDKWKLPMNKPYPVVGWIGKKCGICPIIRRIKKEKK